MGMVVCIKCEEQKKKMVEKVDFKTAIMNITYSIKNPLLYGTQFYSLTARVSL